MNRLGIEFQTVYRLPPVEFVNLAADLGCRYIAIVLSGSPENPYGYGSYSQREPKPGNRPKSWLVEGARQVLAAASADDYPSSEA